MSKENETLQKKSEENERIVEQKNEINNPKSKKIVKIIRKGAAKGALTGIIFSESTMATLPFFPIIIPITTVSGIIKEINNNNKNDFKEKDKNEINANLKNSSPVLFKSCSISKKM